MQQVIRTLHVMSVGLWFGTTIFFAVIAGMLFSRLGALGSETTERPAWFPLPTAHASDPPGDELKKLGKEQGIRAAGYVIGPLFDWYYMIQSVCGVIALVTALSWARMHSRTPAIHKIRVGVLIVAVLTVTTGWYLVEIVKEKTLFRDATSEEVLKLKTSMVTPEVREKAENARVEFERYHGYSFSVNIVGMIAVAIAMGLAAQLPEPEPPFPKQP